MQIDKDKLIGELYCYIRVLEQEVQQLREDDKGESDKDDES